MAALLPLLHHSSTHQVQNRLHDVPVANLPDLDEAHQDGEFHLNIPYRYSGVDHPGREDHGAGCGHHPFRGRSGASARGDLRLLSGGARRRMGVLVCVRERGSRARWCWNRLLARHFPSGNREERSGRRGLSHLLYKLRLPPHWNHRRRNIYNQTRGVLAGGKPLEKRYPPENVYGIIRLAEELKVWQSGSWCVRVCACVCLSPSLSLIGSLQSVRSSNEKRHVDAPCLRQQNPAAHAQRKPFQEGAGAWKHEAIHAWVQSGLSTT